MRFAFLAIAPWVLAGCGVILGLDDPADPAIDGGPTSDTSGDTSLEVAPETSGGSSGPDAPPPFDDSGPARACDLSKPFGTPLRIAGKHINTTYAEEGTPRLSPNELTLYFWSDRTGDGGVDKTHIYVATRASIADPFGEPVRVGGVTSTANESSATLTADGLVMAFESDRLTGNDGELFLSIRNDADAGFGVPTRLTSANSDANQGTPYLRPDGAFLYFSSNRGGTQDLYRAARASTEDYAAAQSVAELNSPSDEFSPCVTANDRGIFWGSNRKDLPSEGDYDIYYAERVSTDDGFGNIVNAGTLLNSTALDLPGWISPDGCTLYLESTRDGQRDIYVSRRGQ